MNLSRILLGWTTVLAAWALQVGAEENWPQFLGPQGNGLSAAAKLPTTWSETQHVKWKTPLPGQGWSSPVIWGDQIWATTATREGRSLRALCVDKNTGKIIHDVEVFALEKAVPKIETNSWASPTPVIEEGRVYVCFGTTGSVCLDTRTAKPIWTSQELKLDHGVGPGSSPILYKDLYILNCDGVDAQYIAALNKETGKLVWKTPRSMSMEGVPKDEHKAFSTPSVISVDGQDRLISIGARRFYAYDPAAGKEVWFCSHPGYSNASRPVFAQGLAFLSSGFVRAELLAVRLEGAAGDVTKTHVAWRSPNNISLKPTFLPLGEDLYILGDTGIVRCVRAKTGEQVWQKRLTKPCSASPIFGADLIFIFSEQNESVVLKPGGTAPEVVATNTLEGGCMATPAVSGNALYIRTKTHLYRVEE
jgi:outer membrane protein assembly factor BamB